MRSVLTAYKVTNFVLTPITGSGGLEFLNYKNFMCLCRCVKLKNVHERNETWPVRIDRYSHACTRTLRELTQ